jgi:uncharacterized membrane protein YfcA
LSVETAIYAIIAVFAAGLIKGLTGFGFSLLSVPVLVVLLGPRTAVPVIILLNAVANVVLFPLCREAAHLRRIVPLIVAGIATVPLGLLLLLSLDPEAVKLLAGCVTILFALAFLTGFQRPVRNEKWGFAAAGLISGTLNGLISTGGPPAVLFLTNQGVPKQAFRASLLAYFLFLSLASVPMFLAGGLLSVAIARCALLLLPAMFLGAFAGSKLLRKLPERGFRVTALIIVMFAGLLSVLSSLGIV